MCNFWHRTAVCLFWPIISTLDQAYYNNNNSNVWTQTSVTVSFTGEGIITASSYLGLWRDLTQHTRCWELSAAAPLENCPPKNDHDFCIVSRAFNIWGFYVNVEKPQSQVFYMKTLWSKTCKACWNTTMLEGGKKLIISFILKYFAEDKFAPRSDLNLTKSPKTFSGTSSFVKMV